MLRKGRHINELETLCLVVALKQWAQYCRNKRIVIYSMVTVEVVNSGKARKNFLQECLRKIVFTLSINRAELKVIHVPGKEN